MLVTKVGISRLLGTSQLSNVGSLHIDLEIYLSFDGGPYPFAQTGDVHRANGFIRNFEYTLTNEGKQYSKSFPTGTILITIAAVIGATAITEAETWATDSVRWDCSRRRNERLFFLSIILRTQRHYLENVAATSNSSEEYKPANS